MRDRLLISANFDAIAPGGGAEHSVDMAREWLRRGFRVHLLTHDTGRSLGDLHPFHADGRLLVHPFGNAELLHFPHQFDQGLYEKAARLIAEIRPESIHTHNFHGLIGAIWAAVDSGCRSYYTSLDFGLLCMNWYLYDGSSTPCSGPTPMKCRECMLRQHRVPLGKALFSRLPESVIGLLGKDVLRQKRQSLMNGYYGKAGAHLEKMVPLLKRFDGILTISPITGKTFQQYGVQASKIHYFTQGITPRPRPGGAGTSGPTTLTFLGHVSPIKGLPVLVKALVGLPDDVELRINLHGNPQAAEEFVRAQPEPVRRRLIVGKQLVGAEVEAQLAKTDGTIVPSQWHENTPYAVIRTLSAGRPVLVSRLEGMTHLIEHGRNGMTVPHADPEAWRAALIKVAREPEYLRGMRAKCNYTKTIEQYAEEIENAISSP